MSKIMGLMQVRPRDLAVELRKEYEILRGYGQRKPLASYIGWTGQGNLGDEILLDAHKRLFPELAIVPYRPDVTIRALAGVSRHRPGFAIGFLGGGTLINQSPTWLRRIVALQHRGMPVYCLGAGVTPHDFRLSFEDTKLSDWVPVLESMEFVGVRGPHSQLLLANAGFNAEITGDPALSLAPQFSPPPADMRIIGINVGISHKTILWDGSDNFLSEIVALITSLLSEGREVRLLPVCADDVLSNLRIASRVDNPLCTVRVAHQSLDAYNAELMECGVFMGQKLHATVLATLLRIPSLMMEYQPKCRDYMASIGMEKYVIKTSEFTADWASAKLAELAEQANDIRVVLNARVTHFRERQHELAQQILQQVLMHE